MKNLITITLLIFALSSSAQTIGILVQPEFETSIVRKGFFAETKVFDRVGIYSDFKLGKELERGTYFIQEHYFRTEHIQLNAGLSFEVLPKLKAIASKSVINKSNMHLQTENDYEKLYSKKNDPLLQFGLLYKEGFLSVLATYETHKRATLGIGFNF